MHPNRQLPGLFVVRPPPPLFAALASCRVSFVFPRGGGGGEGAVILSMFPSGGEDTVTRRRLLFKGRG